MFMNTITVALAALVVVEHIYIMILETVATRSKTTARVFSMSLDELSQKHVATLLKNQGVYNAVLAVLLAVALWQADVVWTRLLLSAVVLVAAYGSLTSNRWIVLKQGGLAIAALIASFMP